MSSEIEKRKDSHVNYISRHWASLSEIAKRIVYVRAGRRVLPIAEAYFPQLPFAREALDLAEIAIAGNALKGQRNALLRKYTEEAPCLHDGEQRDDAEHARRHAAIMVNEACLHALCWNLQDYQLGHARSAAYWSGGAVAELEETRAQVRDIESLLTIPNMATIIQAGL